MKKLIQGIAEFRRNLTEENRRLFASLVLGQKPDALFIACSDSRVVPNIFASTNPGDLFVLRNLGNLIPSVSSTTDGGPIATIEFSLFTLNIADIIVCGHSECGTMQTLLNGFDAKNCPHLASWLKHGQESVEKVKKGMILDPTLAVHNQLSQANVLQQIEHISNYPFVRERLLEKKLRVHGWWFDIAQASVYCYEPSQRRFILINDEEASAIMERLTPDRAPNPLASSTVK